MLYSAHVERERSEIEFQHPRCPFCHDVVAKGTKPEVCSSCHALHHPECWESHGACSACGYSLADPAVAAPAKDEPRAVAQVSLEDPAERVSTPAPWFRLPGPRVKSPPGVSRFASRFMFVIGLGNIAFFSVLSIWWGDADFRLLCQFFVLLGIVVLGMGVKFHLDAKRDSGSA